MSIPNKQIGWSQESNLLWYILKQLNKLTSIIFNLKPKYKVYTALLTQSGGDDLLSINSGLLTIGVTYYINGFVSGWDFTNVGAPNNNDGTYFIATGTTPNSWGDIPSVGNDLQYNTGAPVVTVLENTIGNVWFRYESAGFYTIKVPIIAERKVVVFTSSFAEYEGINQKYILIANNSIDGEIYIRCSDGTSLIDNLLYDFSIEIRVYN